AGAAGEAVHWPAGGAPVVLGTLASLSSARATSSTRGVVCDLAWSGRALPRVILPWASDAMDIYTLDPLRDTRWAEFVERHPRASIFHTPGWLDALERTYGFEPIAFTTSGPFTELQTALLVAAVRSRLTGRRLISLPFSDHCDALVDTPDEMLALTGAVA